MARPTPELIYALRQTARNLKRGIPYQWGHMGGCNCGNLAQQLTKLNRNQIHQYAMQRHGDWSEQAESFCSTSQMPIDLLINEMLAAGLTLEDLNHLEKLDDRQVLRRFPFERRFIKYNVREDVIAYMNVWAELLEEQLLEKITLPSIDAIEWA